MVKGVPVKTSFRADHLLEDSDTITGSVALFTPDYHVSWLIQDTLLL